ncbi:flavodoxin family protein [Chloroflexota bacterium]
MFEVVYYALCGNNRSVCKSTVGLAEEIALELGIEAGDIREKQTLNGGAFVFLGSSCYGGKQGGATSRFFSSNDFKGRQVALFGTTLNSKVRKVEELLGMAGALLKGSFYCERKALSFFHKA